MGPGVTSRSRINVPDSVHGGRYKWFVDLAWYSFHPDVTDVRGAAQEEECHRHWWLPSLAGAYCTTREMVHTVGPASGVGIVARVLPERLILIQPTNGKTPMIMGSSQKKNRCVKVAAATLSANPGSSAARSQM